MSRKEWDNENLRFVDGVDHIVGPFVQVYAQPADEQDLPLICIDDTRFEVMPMHDKMPPELIRYVQTLRKQDMHSETCVNRIAQICGFKHIEKEIYELWD